MWDAPRRSPLAESKAPRRAIVECCLKLPNQALLGKDPTSEILNGNCEPTKLQESMLSNK